MGEGMVNAQGSPGQRQPVEDQSIAVHLEDVTGAVEGYLPGVRRDALPFWLDAPGAGIHSVGGRINPAYRAERGLKLRSVEHAVAEPDGSGGIGGHHATVMRVGKIQATEMLGLPVGAAVAIGVLQEPVARLFRDQHAVGREGDSVEGIEPGGEDGELVGLAVPVGVFEHHELIFLGLARQRVREAGHGDYPETASAIEGDLHRGAQRGKLLLRSEEVHGISGGDLESGLHLGSRFYDTDTVGGSTGGRHGRRG